MELNKGFKQTELGVLPEQWSISKITEIADYVDYRGKTPTKANNGVLLVTAKNIRAGYIDYKISEEYILESVYEQAMSRGKPQVGDVLITTEAPLGMVACVDREDIALAQRVIKYRGHKDKVYNPYLKYFFLSQYFQRKLDENSIGSTAKGIKGSVLHQLPVAIPEKKEQEAIANALSDADAYIESLEKLITKKGLIKKGVMQELLTGKRRLNGFKDKWTTKSFGELFHFSGGYSASRDDLSDEGYPYLHYGDIHTSNKNYIDLPKEAHIIPKLNISLSDASASSVLQNGDVVFVDASEDDEGTSKHVVIYNPDNLPFISGLHTIVAKAKTSEIDVNFRRFCFQTAEVKRQFKFYAVGTKVSGVSKTNIAKINLTFPNSDEQKAIANILIDIESEQENLALKLQKARLVKQGMMQELLTGRIRLV